MCLLVKTKYKRDTHTTIYVTCKIGQGFRWRRSSFFPAPFLRLTTLSRSLSRSPTHSASHYFYTEVIVNQFLCAYRKTGTAAVAHTTTITVPPPCAQPIIHGENIKTVRRRQLVQALFPHSRPRTQYTCSSYII